jgi:hypothetical protein
VDITFADRSQPPISCANGVSLQAAFHHNSPFNGGVFFSYFENQKDKTELCIQNHIRIYVEAIFSRKSMETVKRQHPGAEGPKGKVHRTMPLFEGKAADPSPEREVHFPFASMCLLQ